MEIWVEILKSCWSLNNVLFDTYEELVEWFDKYQSILKQNPTSSKFWEIS